MMEKVAVATSQRSYEVVVDVGVLDRLGDLWPAAVGSRRALVVSDRNVAPLYLERLRRSLDAAGTTVDDLVLPPGESQKSLTVLESVYAALYERGVTREDAVVALGGGVVGDLAGLAAATWQRGTRFVQAPTTLLAMVDASVGGKTAVDFREAKNYVGAFHQPWLVVADPATLSTLPGREVACGWAEIVKHGLLTGGRGLEAVECEAASGALPSVKLVADSVRFKAAVVVADEREETGRRAVLNLGHTLGHAIEAATRFSRYRHGEAVGLGLRAMLWLSRRLAGLDEASERRAQELLSAVGLPERLEGVGPASVAALVARDKKMSQGRVGFVLLPAFGEPSTGRPVPDELVKEVLEWLAAR